MSSSAGFQTWRAGSRMQSMSGSMYATPFVLDQDKSNKYAINDKLKSTQEPEQTHMIPFLRDHDATEHRVKAENEGRTLARKAGRTAQSRKRLMRRELSWNNYSKPISKYNESVH